MGLMVSDIGVCCRPDFTVEWIEFVRTDLRYASDVGVLHRYVAWHMPPD